MSIRRHITCLSYGVCVVSFSNRLLYQLRIGNLAASPQNVSGTTVLVRWGNFLLVAVLVVVSIFCEDVSGRHSN
jgi:hypothetical protein